MRKFLRIIFSFFVPSWRKKKTPSLLITPQPLEKIEWKDIRIDNKIDNNDRYDIIASILKKQVSDKEVSYKEIKNKFIKSDEFKKDISRIINEMIEKSGDDCYLSRCNGFVKEKIVAEEIVSFLLKNGVKSNIHNNKFIFINDKKALMKLFEDIKNEKETPLLETIMTTPYR